MVLIIILIVAILTVIWMDREKRKMEFKGKPDMINHKVYNFWTIVLMLLALLQAPILYYYTSGLFSVFVTILYLSIALIITGIILRSWIKKKDISVFHKAGVSFSIILGIVSSIWGSETIEQLDWKYRRAERESIVKKALNGDIKDEVLATNYFPPISNGGKVLVESKSPGNVTVTFFIDRGLLDHYIAYIYTNDKSLIEDFDARTKSEWHRTNKKIDENWYRIAE